MVYPPVIRLHYYLLFIHIQHKFFAVFMRLRQTISAICSYLPDFSYLVLLGWFLMLDMVSQQQQQQVNSSCLPMRQNLIFKKIKSHTLAYMDECMRYTYGKSKTNTKQTNLRKLAGRNVRSILKALRKRLNTTLWWNEKWFLSVCWVAVAALQRVNNLK